MPAVLAKRLARALARLALAPLIGPRIHGRARLPAAGPALVVANHDSHLDALALFAALPRSAVASARTAAAADHFGGDCLLARAARRGLGIVLVDRHCGSAEEALAGVDRALAAGAVVIFFPEGTRGEPGRVGPFRRGIAHLAARHPGVPVVPVHLAGFGRALPRGSALPLPTPCAMRVGEPVDLSGVAPEDVPEAVRRAVLALAPPPATIPVDSAPGRDLPGGAPVRV